jgi:hypothetical protein
MQSCGHNAFARDTRATTAVAAARVGCTLTLRIALKSYRRIAARHGKIALSQMSKLTNNKPD